MVVVTINILDMPPPSSATRRPVRRCADPHLSIAHCITWYSFAHKAMKLFCRQQTLCTAGWSYCCPPHWSLARYQPDQEGRLEPCSVICCVLLVCRTQCEWMVWAWSGYKAVLAGVVYVPGMSAECDRSMVGSAPCRSVWRRRLSQLRQIRTVIHEPCLCQGVHGPLRCNSRTAPPPRHPRWGGCPASIYLEHTVKGHMQRSAERKQRTEASSLPVLVWFEAFTTGLVRIPSEMALARLCRFAVIADVQYANKVRCWWSLYLSLVFVALNDDV